MLALAAVIATLALSGIAFFSEEFYFFEEGYSIYRPKGNWSSDVAEAHITQVRGSTNPKSNPLDHKP